MDIEVLDKVPFSYDFTPEGKAAKDGEALKVTVEENGDLVVEGYAAVWEGEDREGENFAPGAFMQGVKSFLGGQASWCYHHKHDKLIGGFEELQEDGKGLRFKARALASLKNHPEMGVVYDQIKAGQLRGMSVGGFFKRAIVDGMQKIVGVDITEISSTPVPVHPGTSLNVVGAKALEDVQLPKKPKVDGDIRAEDEEMVNMLIGELDRIFSKLKRRGNGPAKESFGGEPII